MDLIYADANKEDVGVMHDYTLDLAFGMDENDFECSIVGSRHCCESGFYLYCEGTEYGGIIDDIGIDSEADELIYYGRTWHGILNSKVIEPLKETDKNGGGVVVTCGKNLLKNTAESQTVNGVTFTVNEDGSVTVNGTATDSVWFNVGNIELQEGVSYTISGSPKGGAVNTRYGFYILGSDIGVNSYDSGEGATFTCPTTKSYTPSIIIRSGITINNTFYPMIRLASDTDSTYEPYKENPLDEYLILSGEANDVLQWLIDRMGLSNLFKASTESSGINISNYQMNRYIEGYDGIRKMLKAFGAKLKISFTNGFAELSAVPFVDYSQDEQFDSDQISLKIKKKGNPINHVICLGKGDLAEREVIHVYADASGNISNTQVFTGIDEVEALYDNSNAESSTVLQQGGIDMIKKSWGSDEIGFDFNSDDENYDVGDVVGAREHVTGIEVSAEITKKIVTIKDNTTTISYKVGE